MHHFLVRLFKTEYDYELLVSVLHLSMTKNSLYYNLRRILFIKHLKLKKASNNNAAAIYCIGVDSALERSLLSSCNSAQVFTGTSHT